MCIRDRQTADRHTQAVQRRNAGERHDQRVKDILKKVAHCLVGLQVKKMCIRDRLGMDHCMKSGIGSYAVQVGPLKVGAVVAVNAAGDIYDLSLIHIFSIIS